MSYKKSRFKVGEIVWGVYLFLCGQFNVNQRKGITMKLSRRDFLKMASAAGLASILPIEIFQKALGGNGNPRVIWLQGQSCTGCSVSLLNSVNITTIDDVLLNYINLEYHSNLIASAGDFAISNASGPHPSVNEMAVLSDEWLRNEQGLSMDVTGPQGVPDGKVDMVDFAAICKQGYILVVEGSIPTGSSGRFCHIGSGMTMIEAFDQFSTHAQSIIAVGTCASFGGIPAANPKPTNALSVDGALAYLSRTKTVINIPGCPIHPDWFVGTGVNLLAGNPVTLDSYKRPMQYFGNRIHQEGNCPFKGWQEVHNLGEQGCLKEIGCKGTVTYADCYSRKWNNPGKGQAGVNWCVAARTPCHGCTQPNFPDGMTPFYDLHDMQEG
jgi:hydrogenase small subunit